MADGPISQQTPFTPTQTMQVPVYDPAAGNGLKNGRVSIAALAAAFGLPGATGANGAMGPIGLTGPAGPAGATGAAGMLTPASLAYATTLTPVMSGAGASYYVTLTGNATLANPSSVTPGQALLLDITQDSTGSRLLAFGSAYVFPNGITPVLSTAAGARDLLYGEVLHDSTILLAPVYGVAI